MRAVWNQNSASTRSAAKGAWTALLSMLALCLFATAPLAHAGVPPMAPGLVVSETTTLGLLPAGGIFAAGSAAGTSFAVNSNGDILIGNSYGSDIYLVNGHTGAYTALATGFGQYGNAGPVTLDSANNLYIGQIYSGVIVKIPYNAATGQYAAVSNPSTTPANCTGSDTTECNYAPALATAGVNGVASMAFDSQGNFYVATSIPTTKNTSGNYVENGSNAIYECSTACIAGSAAATQIYAPSNTGNPTGYYNEVGAVAVDPSGNVFFTESQLNGAATAAANESDASWLYELVNTSGTLATTPTTIESFTVATPAGYDDELSALTISPNGTIYYGTINDGTFAIPDVSGTLGSTYQVSTQGAKTLAMDGKGNLYAAAYLTSGDGVARISMNSVPAPASAVGTLVTVSNMVTVMDAAGCGTSPAIHTIVSEEGARSTEFAATAGTCASQSNVVSPAPAGSYFPLTATFTPTAIGERTAVLTVADTANSYMQTAIASGVGQGQSANLDTGTTTSYTGFTAPGGVAVDAAGNIYVADYSTGQVYIIKKGSTTPSSSGVTFVAPTGLALDASGDLFIVDSGSNDVVEFPFSGGSPDPTKHTTLISSSMTFGGTTLSTPEGIVVGPNGTIYISDNGNNRVVSYNPQTGLAGVRVTGLNKPEAIAVDASDNLYVVNSGASPAAILEYSGGGVINTIALPTGITAPSGIAVEASGALFVADNSTGNVVRIPNVAGVLTPASATQVATLPMSSASGLALDVNNNVYASDAAGAAVYAINRASGTPSFGSVYDGSTNAVDETISSSGTAALALNSPLATLNPTTAPYSVAAGSTNGCTSTVNSGTACTLSFTFAPTGSMTGVQSATATLASGAATNPVINLAGTAAVPLGTTTVLSTITPTTMTSGTAISLTATVTQTSGGAAVTTGSVTFMSGTTALGAAVNVNGSGVATLPNVVLPVGSDSITAVYGGSGNLGTSTSAAQVIVVSTPAPVVISTTTTLKASATSITQGTSETLTATVSAASGTATGTVTFMDGSTTLGTGTLASGVATFTTTTLPVGSDSISASYAASGNYAASTSSAVTVTVTAPTTPTVGIQFSTNTLTVQAGVVGQVTFTVTPTSNFVGTVSLACSGLPNASNCVFSPSSFTFTAANDTKPQTGTLNVVTTSRATAALMPYAPIQRGAGSSMPMLAGAFWLPGLLAAGAGLRKKNSSRTLHLLVLLVLLAGVGMMTACGGGSPLSSGNSTTQTSGTPAGKYTVTVTANGTGATTAPSGTFTLQVQ